MYKFINTTDYIIFGKPYIDKSLLPKKFYMLQVEIGHTIAFFNLLSQNSTWCSQQDFLLSIYRNLSYVPNELSYRKKMTQTE